MKKDWLTPNDLEDEFNIKKGTQGNLRSDKKIPYTKIGNFIFYNREKLYKWFDAHHIEPTS